MTDGTLLRIHEARAILGVSHTQLRRLIDQNVLKLVSSLSIDRSGVNLFLRTDVEKLHQRRESFKRQRLLEGGSDRFGSPVGARSAPVRSAIGPRIDELIVSATINGKRLTGPPLHRELLKEGFVVGINSVYLYLRECRVRNESIVRQ